MINLNESQAEAMSCAQIEYDKAVALVNEVEYEVNQRRLMDAMDVKQAMEENDERLQGD